jgi:hypothetical protein
MLDVGCWMLEVRGGRWDMGGEKVKVRRLKYKGKSLKAKDKREKT